MKWANLVKGIKVMSSKDYTAIALEIRNQLALSHSSKNAIATKVALRAIADRLAIQFANDNSRFNRSQFITACGF
jgi:hypothetical protein